MDDIVCSIIRAAFSGGAPTVLPEGVGAAEVYAELQAQAISGLALVPGGLADALPQDAARRALVGDWQNRDLYRRALFGHLLDVQDEMLGVLAAQGIPVVILKGTAAGMYYADPALRAYGDIDFMVVPTDVERARSALVAVGFTVADDIGSCNHHMSLDRAGVHLELHWKPNGIPRGSSEKRLIKLFEEGMANTETACVTGHEFPVFPPLLNGVVLLLHARHHLSHGGLGFRQIIDWMLFARAYLADGEWDEFARLLGDERLVKSARWLTRFCQLYLGMPEEGFAWCVDVDPVVCEDVLAHVMLMGNFGHKVASDRKTGTMVLVDARDPLDFIGNLQRNGYINWKAAQRHAVLKPFCWLYQICRYARIIVTRPHAVASMRSDFKDAAWRRRLNRELGIYD